MFKILTILLLLTTSQLYSQPYITPASQTVCYGDNYNTLTLQNNTKPIVRWEMSVTGSDPWITIINQTINLSFNDLTTNTWFRAVVRAEGELEQYSASAVVNVSSKAVPGIISGT